MSKQLNHHMPAEAAAAGALEVLAFTIGAEEYAVDIGHVQELRSYETVTRIANAPSHMLGVVNLRGLIVPIVDLRVRMGIAQPAYNDFTVVVVLTLPGGVAGMVVDSVSDVITLAPEQLKPAPTLGAHRQPYLRGVAAVGERMLIVVDIASMLALHDIPEPALLAA
jgi:purine-binding chemotaxis protein CheW